MNKTFTLHYSNKNKIIITISAVVLFLIAIVGLFKLLQGDYSKNPWVFLSFGFFGFIISMVALLNMKKPYTITFMPKEIDIIYSGKSHLINYLYIKNLKLFRIRSRKLGEKVDVKYSTGTLRNPKVLCEEGLWQNGSAENVILAIESSNDKFSKLPAISIEKSEYDEMLNTFSQYKTDYVTKMLSGENKPKF